jgi:WXG100 family type VII secretion target
MASYSLDPNGLLDTSSDLQGITNSIKNSIDDLDGAVRNFLQNNAGMATVSYTDAQTQWDAGIAQMHAAIHAASAALVRIHDNYDLGDRRGAAMFGGGNI